VVAITGGIGSGKSVVSRLLRVMGTPVYDTDVQARRLMLSDPAIKEALTGLLGAEAYLADGSLNKPLLAQYLFASAQHNQQINDIVHPVVRQDLRRWVAEHPEKVVAFESAILYESGFHAEASCVWMVYAPQEARLQRVAERDGLRPEQVAQRMERQMPDEEKCRRADIVLANDGRKPLIPQVIDALKSLV